MRQTRWITRSLGGAAVALLAALAFAAAPAPATVGGLSVVGQAAYPGGSPTIFVAAFSLPSATWGTFVLGGRGQYTYVVSVRCIRKAGDHVLVGGKVIWDTNPSVSGSTSMLSIKDDPAGDRVTIAFSNSGLDSCPDIAPGVAVNGDFTVLPF